MDLLLSYGADVTLENDSHDSVLDVVGEDLRRHILSEERGREGRKGEEKGEEEREKKGED